MIRFVPVGKAIYPDMPEYHASFAFYSTSSDQFVMFDGEHVWKTWEEFAVTFFYANGENSRTRRELERYRSLIPEGHFDVEEEEGPKAARNA